MKGNRSDFFVPKVSRFYYFHLFFFAFPNLFDLGQSKPAMCVDIFSYEMLMVVPHNPRLLLFIMNTHSPSIHSYSQLPQDFALDSLNPYFLFFYETRTLVSPGVKMSKAGNLKYFSPSKFLLDISPKKTTQSILSIIMWLA